MGSKGSTSMMTWVKSLLKGKKKDERTIVSNRSVTESSAKESDQRRNSGANQDYFYFNGIAVDTVAKYAYPECFTDEDTRCIDTSARDTSIGDSSDTSCSGSACSSESGDSGSAG